MRYNSFPCRFGSRKASMTKAIVDMLTERLKFGYSDSDESLSWAEMYSMAKAIEYVFRYNGSVAKNAIPGNATFSLEDWERAFGISVIVNRDEVSRRNVLAGKWLNLSNTTEYLGTIAKKIFGNQFDAIYTDNAIQYWSLNPHPEPGFDWVAGICHLVFHVNGAGNLSDDEYLKRCSDLSKILDQIMPIYGKFSFSKGECFRAGIGKLGISPLCSGA